jgi:hypothetical protein
MASERVKYEYEAFVAAKMMIVTIHNDELVSDMRPDRPEGPASIACNRNNQARSVWM